MFTEGSYVNMVRIQEGCIALFICIDLFAIVYLFHGRFPKCIRNFNMQFTQLAFRTEGIDVLRNEEVALPILSRIRFRAKFRWFYNILMKLVKNLDKIR